MEEEEEEEEKEKEEKEKEGKVLKTRIEGFDELFAEGGVPKGNSILVAGGTGTGKSTLQTNML